MRQMPLEMRIKYQVTKDFTAHRFSADAYMAEDESYGTDDVAISVGDILDADLNVWHGKRWKGVPVVVFFREMLQCCVSETIFIKSTKTL